MIIWILSALAGPPGEALPPFPSRGDVVQDWLRADPRDRAASEEIAAAKAGAAGAVPLSPLMVNVDVAPLMGDMLGAEVGASWMLPAPRMRASQTALALAGVADAQAAARMTSAELAAEASQLVDEVWEIAALRLIFDQHDAVLAAAAEAVARRLGAGLATPEQRVMADMARVELAEQRLTLERRASVVEARLAPLLEAAPAPAPGEASDGSVGAGLRGLRAWTRAAAMPPEPGPVLYTSEVHSPAVEMAEADLAMAREMETMARRAGAPMTELMLSYSSMWGDPAMGLMAGVGVEIPIDGRVLRQQRIAAELGTNAAEARVTAAKWGASQEEAAALAMVEEMAAMETLMRERMAPLTAERVRLARTAFENNRGTLADWLAAVRDDAHTAQRLVETRAELHRAEAMVAMARGELAGTELELK